MSHPAQLTEPSALPAAISVISISPVIFPVPERAAKLQLKISAPVTGQDLPVILLSHGHGNSNHLSSLNGYGPLAHFWAAHGFVVIQPTHLDSRTLSLGADAPGGPLFWRSRVEDMTTVLDHLTEITAALPGLKGRVDPARVAVVGHSLGGQTAGMLLGARLTDPQDPAAVDVKLKDDRVKAGILLAAPGRGGDDLSAQAAAHYTFLNPDFSEMTTPTLVVAGDRDVSAHLSTRGADWHADPYTLSPGPKGLLTLFGAEHGLGGVAGYDAKETTDESPERVLAVQQLTWAYLRSTLFPQDNAWADSVTALRTSPNPLGRIECK
ncbi:alpha/beta hydrolase family protein [Deinococcus sp. UYEF24]